VLQRRSDLIISGGENVYPAEVERALRAHSSVADALVIGAPDAEWGQRVAALLVPKPGRDIDVDDVLRFAREHLAGYKLPRIVRIVHALPLLPNGKIDRRAAAFQISDFRFQISEDGGSSPPLRRDFAHFHTFRPIGPYAKSMGERGPGGEA